MSSREFPEHGSFSPRSSRARIGYRATLAVALPLRGARRHHRRHRPTNAAARTSLASTKEQTHRIHANTMDTIRANTMDTTHANTMGTIHASTTDTIPAKTMDTTRASTTDRTRDRSTGCACFRPIRRAKMRSGPMNRKMPALLSRFRPSTRPGVYPRPRPRNGPERRRVPRRALHRNAPMM